MTTQPSIFPFGIRIDEPVTTLTDLLVSAVCFYAFWGIRKKMREGQFKTYTQYYFLSMGIATLIGGIIGHGFLYAFSFAWKLPGWITSMLSITLVERAAIYKAGDFLSDKMNRFLSILNVVELLIFMGLAFYTLNFLYVEIHSAYGLLGVVATLSFFIYRKTRNRGSRLYLQAVGFAAAAAFFFTVKWSPHLWFNYIDLSHVLMAISAWFFYKGSLAFEPEKKYA